MKGLFMLKGLDMKNISFLMTSVKYLSVLLIILFLATCGYSQIQDNLLDDNTRADTQLSTDSDEPITVESNKYTNSTTDNIPLVSDAKVSGVQETVNGLKEAKYSLQEIVDVLANDDKNAAEISIACLRAGYNGREVYSALRNNDSFSENEVNAAVPPALRTEGQLFTLTASQNLDPVIVEMALIEPNPFTKGVIQSVDNDQPTIQSNNNTTSSTEIDPIQVEVSVGVVSFDGLGDWKKFQNDRFNNE